ncbi:MAG: AAA family ATPase [Acidobacteriota bacterium]|nr:AAA family ATPase [Acidobacteriota bacterium]
MKTLPQISAVSEQLPIISQNRLGVEIICGAAGSGKTSTALLRLKSLFFMFAARRKRQGDPEPIRALVLTFNRTLAGYVRALAEQQVSENMHIDLEIETFGRWAMSHLDIPEVQDNLARVHLRNAAQRISELTPDYVVNEVEYLTGRFAPEDIEDYITVERTGRGTRPRIGRELRRRILSEVVEPYQAWLDNQQALDWNMVSIEMMRAENPIEYDVVVVDESQDFSANQLRAIRHHLAAEHAITFVIDTVQRIYARGFTWAEAGYLVRRERSHMLRTNHRNTREIATFAAGILDGISVEGDGALPNLHAAQRQGQLPIVLHGLYNKQAEWAINYIIDKVDLGRESVAFLKPKGGKWFSEIERRLKIHNIPYVGITRKSEWPDGPENVALSTFNSAKGLEFDYVFILGLNDKNTPHDDVEVDDRVFVLRRLLAVAVARARKEVVIGYKPGEESRLVSYFVDGTFREIGV